MPKIDCLFVLRDTGDAQNLLESARLLRQRDKTIQLLVLGNAARAKVESDPLLKHLMVTPESVPGVTSTLGQAPADLGGGSGHRAKFSQSHDAQALADHFEAAVVVTGVVSRAQRNLCTAFKSAIKPPRSVIGYYDSLAINNAGILFHRSSKISRFEQLQGSTSDKRIKKDPFSAPFSAVLDELWAPLPQALAALAERAAMPREKLRALGHPDTEQVLHRLHTRAGQRDDIRGRLGITRDEKLVFYAGGRQTDAENNYRRSFKAFAEGFVGGASNVTTPIKAIVGLHPVSNGQDEAEVVSELGAQNMFRIERTTNAPKSTDEFTTEDLLIASDVVVSWNSTVASQAALLDGLLAKRVCFVDASQTPDGFAVVDAGLAVQCRSAQQFGEFLIGATDTAVAATKAASVLLPADSASSMAQRIIDKLQ